MAGWKTLYKVFYRSLCSYVLTFIKDREVAEDIVQETFIRIWESSKQFSGTEELIRYLYKANYNNALLYIRNKNNRENILAKIGTESEHSENPDELFANTIREELIRHLHEHLQKLPKERKEIMLLSISGLSGAEIAEKLGISISTVKNQKNKTFKQLRSKMKDSFILFLIGV